MNPELRELKDVHLPQAISHWPIAPGWLGLFILILMTLGCAFYFWQKNKQKRYTIQFALAKLESMQSLLIANPDNINIAAEVSTLLRRTALYYFPREQTAALSGKKWLEFLNTTGETNLFTEASGHLLTDVPYQKDNTIDVTPLFELARNWLLTLSKKNAHQHARNK